MNDCCKDTNNHNDNKFKDAIQVDEGFYYTVYITYCKECGTSIDKNTWIE